jgi:hypothetical protein
MLVVSTELPLDFKLRRLASVGVAIGSMLLEKIDHD